MTIPMRTPRFIKRIYVSELFGHYTYDLRTDPSNPEDHARLLILYGDNGSGKTTLLRLVFSLLAPDPLRGHKSFVARTPFQQLRLELLDGTTIDAIRPTSAPGPFRMSVKRRGKLLSQIDWQVDEKLSVPPKAQDAHRQTHILKTLADLKLNLFLLSDDRRISWSPEKPSDPTYALIYAAGQQAGSPSGSRSSQTTARKNAEAAQGIAGAVARVRAWATAWTLAGSTKGDEDANALYAQIVERLSRAAHSTSKSEATLTKQRLLSELETQSRRSLEFSRYGLIGAINIEPFVEALKNAHKANLDAIADVLTPYIDSFKARLDALEPVHAGINSFCQILNSFYTDKRISFDLQQGILLNTAWGTRIAATALSSGERHLLLLFCNILVARDEQSVFIIDEPELSLNVKWQRRLVDTLRNFTNLNRIQFILATHSIELVTRHRAQVLRLSESPGHPANGD